MCQVEFVLATNYGIVDCSLSVYSHKCTASAVILLSYFLPEEIILLSTKCIMTGHETVDGVMFLILPR